VGISPPTALGWFFAVSFFNGILLEIGRKIKLPENEEEGVVSYSKLWGMNNAAYAWLGILAITLILAFVSASAIESPVWVYILLSIFAVAGSLTAFSFLKNPSQKKAKMIENASGLWTMGMYLNLGALPFLIATIF
jgi:4-hydroxybenzoate polyprenyltransferase